jgi:hypothetical protein
LCVRIEGAKTVEGCVEKNVEMLNIRNQKTPLARRVDVAVLSGGETGRRIPWVTRIFTMHVGALQPTRVALKGVLNEVPGVPAGTFA